MEIKAIEIMGNLIILENVIGITTIKKGNANRDTFDIIYSGNKSIVFYESETSLLKDFGEVIVCNSDIPIPILRNKIISIIKEKNNPKQ